jgi:hypothetical protein
VLETMMQMNSTQQAFKFAGELWEQRECCLLVLNLVSSTLPCIRQPRPRLKVAVLVINLGETLHNCPLQVTDGPGRYSIKGRMSRGHQCVRPGPGHSGGDGARARPGPGHSGGDGARARRCPRRMKIGFCGCTTQSQ